MGERKLSEAELYIMRWFWEKGAMDTAALSVLVADKGWKPTTLLTFLSRLVQKGMLKAEKQGRGNLYTPLCTRDEHGREEGQAFLEDMFDGSARDFLAAMVDGRSISKQELAELREWLLSQEEVE